MDARLELKLVGDIHGTFVVPAYQRGYRWDVEQVRLLLADIWGNGDRDYCLQPVVVKPLGADRFELVDGQQRLTTLYLIFLHIKREYFPASAPPFSLEYETRPRSREYLVALDETQKDENIDFFHMYGAYECIRNWFAGRGTRRQNDALRFYTFLFERVKVIWYEADPKVDSSTLFTRLNVGRIPLTNAELVKALLLRRTAEAAASPSSPAATVARHRQFEIASQWDAIERELHDPGLWGFLSNRAAVEYPTRIELLLDLLPEVAYASERFATFYYFKDLLDREDRDEVWQRVLEVHELLKGWYEDRDLYHKVGYLIASGVTLKALVDDSTATTKSAFQRRLDERIRSALDLTREKVMGLTYEEPASCRRLLELANVETVRTLKYSNDRYPFHAHKAQSWTLEHIHAQHTERLNKKEQWREWLTHHRDAIDDLPADDTALLQRKADLLREIDAVLPEPEKRDFERLAPEVARMLSEGGEAEDMHALSNLALLSGCANSTLGNSVFEVKRRKIIGLDRNGEFVPICTRRVFLKYYTVANAQQVHFWSARDRKAYLDAMLDVVSPYLLPDPARQP
jgi:Trp operon repressor